MKNLKLLIVASLCLLSFAGFAQEHHGERETASAQPEHAVVHEEHGKHKVALFAGFTHVSAAYYEDETHLESTGKWVPTLGLEYYYTLSKTFDIGLVADMEFDEYYIRTSEEEELERNNVSVAALVLRYKPIHSLGIFVGPGIETEFFGTEDATSFKVLKAGIDYEIEISKGWELTPVFSYDFKEEYSAYSFGLSIGKRF